MGGDKKKESGNDPRGRSQDMAQQQQQRFYDQQGPLVNQMAYNYGRGSEADMGNYNDMMNMYRNIASGSGTPGEGGGGGGGYSYGAESWAPEQITNNDPYKSYTGYEEFSRTGGYSPTDVANMRARGVSPIRAAYANAEREVGRQRSLQGGYSPNAFAVQAKMAREMGQANADAVQGVEAGLARDRNTGRLKGLEGMSSIEADRYNKDIDIQKYNANARMSAAQSNAAARNAAAAGSASNAMNAAAASRADQFRALEGMNRVYGTNPGLTTTFGNQVGQMVLGGGQVDNQRLATFNQGQQLPGQYDQTMGRINSTLGTIGNIAGTAGTIWNGINSNQNQQRKVDLARGLAVPEEDDYFESYRG